MHRILVYVIVLITTTIYGQNEDEQNVKAAVDIFFEGMHKGDTTRIKAVLMDNVVLQTTYNNKEGKAILVTDELDEFLNIIAEKPESQKWDERLLDYNIQIDGNMANVWTPYEFWFNDAFSHCGVNSFQLFKDGGQWKIVYVMDTRRQSSCNKTSKK